MFKKVLFIFFYCSIMFFASNKDTIPTFILEGVIDPSWGELVTVYDQKNSQRLTFKSDGVITLVSLHLTWSSKESAFTPKVRQIIQLTENEN